MKLLGCCRFPLASDLFAKNTRCRDINRSGVSCKVATPQIYAINGEYKSNSKKKVDIVGSDWSGLVAAYHLCNQGFDVTVLGDGYGFGDPDDVGIHGFCYPYKNIFSLVDELGLKHFTNWLQSAQYSKEGLEVEFPVLQDRPELPAPLGILFYTQGDFDVVWCRGPVKERIFNPWMELMSMKGCRFVDRKKVTDLSFDDKTGCISYVFVTMRHTRQMKLFWLSELPQSKNSLRKVLSTREEFLKVLNLDASDLVSTKLWLGKKVCPGIILYLFSFGFLIHIKIRAI